MRGRRCAGGRCGSRRWRRGACRCGRAGLRCSDARLSFGRLAERLHAIRAKSGGRTCACFGGSRGPVSQWLLVRNVKARRARKRLSGATRRHSRGGKRRSRRADGCCRYRLADGSVCTRGACCGGRCVCRACGRRRGSAAGRAATGCRCAGRRRCGGGCCGGRRCCLRSRCRTARRSRGRRASGGRRCGWCAGTHRGGAPVLGYGSRHLTRVGGAGGALPLHGRRRGNALRLRLRGLRGSRGGRGSGCGGGGCGSASCGGPLAFTGCRRGTRRLLLSAHRKKRHGAGVGGGGVAGGGRRGFRLRPGAVRGGRRAGGRRRARFGGEGFALHGERGGECAINILYAGKAEGEGATPWAARPLRTARSFGEVRWMARC